MKASSRRTIYFILISVVLAHTILFLHFQVIAAADCHIYGQIAQDDTFRIFGTVEVKAARSSIYINIVDQAHFDIPRSGIDTLVLEVSSTIISYEFPKIPQGIYGVRCFQDLNGNGKLDKGMFGPSEPWALSWKEKKKFPPRFKDISFNLHEDKKIDLKLSK